jgi:uncharacterized protein (TIGR02452 family)
MKEKLIKVFEDTQEKAKQFQPGTSYRSIINNRVTNISVENIDTVSALLKYNTAVSSVCLLNMASPKKPGGGVRNGEMAQEESLFRCSNLMESINPNYYPLAEDECIVTEGTTFFKDFDYNDLETPIKCDVITMAAPNISSGGGRYGGHTAYIILLRKKIRHMILTAMNTGADVLILGAWGCGVFKNNPKIVAEAFKEVLVNERMADGFGKIVFAIINDHNSVGSNHEIFKKVFTMKEI